jgi:hypothetical protein
MTTLLSAFLHGTSTLELGIGHEKDAGFLQYPDPSPPYTKGGTILIKPKWVATK